MQKYSHLKISGEVSVRLSKKPNITPHDRTILLMGSTGSGKSSFIEAVAGKSTPLGISKDQLAGYTQGINVYEVINAEHIRPEDDDSNRGGDIGRIYLIDTPGFSDNKISEMEIYRMLVQWVKVNKLDGVDGMFFICPITATRLPGSKRRVIELFKSMITQEPQDDITVVTSMWDTICNEKARERAEANLAQLKDDVWTDIVKDREGDYFARFLNTQDSALHIINEAMGRWIDDITYDNIEGIRPYNHLLYQNLLDRIECSRQQQRGLELDLAQPETKADPELISILRQRLLETNEDLAKFATQLIEFGDPPPGFDLVLLPWHTLSMKARVLQGFRSVRYNGRKLFTLTR